LLASCGKVDLAEAVRSELCSTDRQSKNYRHRLLAGNRPWNKSSKNLDWKGKSIMQKKIKTLKELQEGIKEISKDLDAYTFGMSMDEAVKYKKICKRLDEACRILNKFI
jgi:hypothetical protein